MPVEAERAAHVLKFFVDPLHNCLVQLSLEATGVVRDSIHHVASAELLRVIDRAHTQDRPGFEIYKFKHYCRCP